jgi:hypothetical protein
MIITTFRSTTCGDGDQDGGGAPPHALLDVEDEGDAEKHPEHRAEFHLLK